MDIFINGTVIGGITLSTELEGITPITWKWGVLGRSTAPVFGMVNIAVNNTIALVFQL